MRYLPVLPAPASWPVAGDPLVPLVPVLVEVDPDGSLRRAGAGAGRTGLAAAGALAGRVPGGRIL